VSTAYCQAQDVGNEYQEKKRLLSKRFFNRIQPRCCEKVRLALYPSRILSCVVIGVSKLQRAASGRYVICISLSLFQKKHFSR
jgi:hypothetical protein